MRHLSIVISLTTLAMAGASVAQDTTLFVPSSSVVNYDPFTGLAGLEDITIDIQNTSLTPQTARLVITPDIAPEFRLESSDAPLDFEINSAYGNSNLTRFDVPINIPPSSSSTPVTVTFKIPSGQYADAGDLDMDLKVSLTSQDSVQLLADPKIVNLVGRTPMRAQTNFAGTSAGFENGSTYALVDFGEITSGDSRTVNFQVRGNSEVDITMSSENQGMMRSLTAPNLSPVPYKVNADGSASDLSVPLELTRRPARTLAGTSYPLTITLENSDAGLFAGNYRDIISIDVTPR